MDQALQQALQNLATQGNSFGKSARMRARWTRELDFAVPDARKQPVKYLWFVGDFASFDERLQRFPGPRQDLARGRRRLRPAVRGGAQRRQRRAPGRRGRPFRDARRAEHARRWARPSSTRSSRPIRTRSTRYATNTVALAADLPGPALHRAARPSSWRSGCDQGQALGRPGHLSRPMLPGSIQRVLDAPRRDSARARLRARRDAPQRRPDTFCCGAGGGRIWMGDGLFTERPSENRISEARRLGRGTSSSSHVRRTSTMFSDAVKTRGPTTALSSGTSPCSSKRRSPA